MEGRLKSNAVTRALTIAVLMTSCLWVSFVFPLFWPIEGISEAIARGANVAFLVFALAIFFRGALGWSILELCLSLLWAPFLSMTVVGVGLGGEKLVESLLASFSKGAALTLTAYIGVPWMLGVLCGSLNIRFVQYLVGGVLVVLGIVGTYNGLVESGGSKEVFANLLFAGLPLAVGIALCAASYRLYQGGAFFFFGAMFVMQGLSILYFVLFPATASGRVFVAKADVLSALLVTALLAAIGGGLLAFGHRRHCKKLSSGQLVV